MLLWATLAPLWVLLGALGLSMGPAPERPCVQGTIAAASERALVSTQEDQRVRIAVYSGDGASFRSIRASLKMFEWMGAQVRRISPQEIVQGRLNDFHILYMTGGWAVPYTRDLRGPGVDNIRSFLEGGGGYMGICAGAFFAANRIFWEGKPYDYPLDIFPGYAGGPMEDIAPWPVHRMTRIRLSANEHPITVNEPPSLTVLYYGGPWFHADEGQDIPVLATYSTNGKPAMVAYAFGKGRVFLSGVHPEFEEGDDRDDVLWDKGLQDPESEWPLMLAVVKWLIQGK